MIHSSAQVRAVTRVSGAPRATGGATGAPQAQGRAGGSYRCSRRQSGHRTGMPLAVIASTVRVSASSPCAVRRPSILHPAAPA
ncbi:hypothetical protein [Streptomyces alfalfae]|uniref:hypothetical protein n=1 Tax=Streptomyces alfalfae TaxID=1642299 RepID=UPI0013DE5719|nr:hypothetical protein [Streptomyces alfalfae]